MSLEQLELGQASRRLLARSQDKHPERILDVLVVSAIKESWINFLVNSHVALFFGLLLLASNYDVDTTLLYGSIHLGVLLIVAVMLVFLLRIPADHLVHYRARYISWLSIIDIMIALGWGISMVFFFQTANQTQYDALVFMLLAAGITTAALSAKLIRILTIGRLLVFFPAIVYLMVVQPSDWLLHVTSLTLSFAVCVGIGYAIHIQLLREAATVVELEESRADAKRESKFRETFLRSITHDLRQPLNSMSLFVRSLERKAISAESEVTAIRQCLDASERVLNNVSQLAWVGQRLPQPTVSVISLADILDPLITSTLPHAAAKGLTIKSRATDIHVIADSRYLERAIRNLVDNAINYTDIGRVFVGVRLRSYIGMAEVQVWDTGIGISFNDQRRIFEAYERLSGRHSSEVSGHLGLGLAIVKEIANSINGHVEVSSRPNVGSCFSLYVPIAQQVESDFFANQRVMIVDNDAVYAGFMQTVFVASGAAVTIKSSDEELSELAAQGFDHSDLVVMDFHLSDHLNNGLTGADLLAEHDNYQTAVLISSGEIPTPKDVDHDHNICLLRKTTDPKKFTALILHALGYYS